MPAVLRVGDGTSCWVLSSVVQLTDPAGMVMLEDRFFFGDPCGQGCLLHSLPLFWCPSGVWSSLVLELVNNTSYLNCNAPQAPLTATRGYLAVTRVFMFPASAVM